MNYTGGYQPYTQGSSQSNQANSHSSAPLQPSPYPTTPSPYPTNPSPYPTNPSPYPPQSSPYPSNLTPNSSTNYGLNPVSYGINPTPNPSSLSYPTNPSPYPTPTPYPAMPSYPANPMQTVHAPSHHTPYSYNPPQPLTTTLPNTSIPSPYPSAQPVKPFHSQSHPYHQQSSREASQSTKYRKGTPTVTPVHPFDPKTDAGILRKAMKGFGTDEKAIIQVLANRTNAQRLQIEHNFKTMYGKDLKENLKSELSGKFEKLVLALMTPTVEFQAQELHWAISGIGTDEKTLIEFLCSANNCEIHAVRNTYERLFNKTLESDIIGDTSGYFQRLLVSLCQGRRNENYAVDEAAAAEDAKSLMEAGVLRLGTDEAVFNMILCNRSYPQLAEVFHQYKMFSGHDIDKAIKSEFSGDIETGLLAIVKCVNDKPGFFAEQLYKSMKGLGTDDRALIRLVTLRSEIDMVDIKCAFQTNYGKSLKKFIEGDTSGDYKKCLLALIKE